MKHLIIAILFTLVYGGTAYYLFDGVVPKADAGTGLQQFNTFHEISHTIATVIYATELGYTDEFGMKPTVPSAGHSPVVSYQHAGSFDGQKSCKQIRINGCLVKSGCTDYSIVRDGVGVEFYRDNMLEWFWGLVMGNLVYHNPENSPAVIGYSYPYRVFIPRFSDDVLVTIESYDINEANEFARIKEHEFVIKGSPYGEPFDITDYCGVSCGKSNNGKKN